MPSPIAHFGVVPPLLKWARCHSPSALKPKRARILVIAIAAITIAPDVDLLFGLLTGDGIFAFHNGPTHSLIGAFVAGIVGGAGLRLLGFVRTLPAMLIGVSACLSHVLLDALTWGRGVLLWWPLSAERVTSPILLFVGVRHSENAPLRDHLLSLFTEVLFVAAVLLLLRSWNNVRRKSDQIG